MKITLLGRTTLSLAALTLVASGPIAAQILTKNTSISAVPAGSVVSPRTSDKGTNPIPLDPAIIVPLPAAKFSSSTEKVADVFGSSYQNAAPLIRPVRDEQTDTRTVANFARNEGEAATSPAAAVPSVNETPIPFVFETTPGSADSSKPASKPSLSIRAASGAKRLVSQTIPEPGTASLLMSTLASCACFVGVRRKK